MREIKYQAWDGKNMHEVLYISLNHDEIGILNGIRLYYRGGLKNCELRQYTGLKDKNGKDIYEGDVLDFGGSLQQIEFDRGCFYMAQYEGADTVPWLLDIKYNEQSEIIGNIYENPELLTN